MTRLELRESIGDRPPRTVAVVSQREDGSIEITGEPTTVDFLANYRVHDTPRDRWVSKDEDPALWLELIPRHVESPFRRLVPA